MTEDGIKTTGRDAGVVPRTVIHDPDLTRSLPLGMTVASGLNAIAYCMEGLYAVDGNPIVSMMAEEDIRSLYESLGRKRVVEGKSGSVGVDLGGRWRCKKKTKRHQ